jgi:secondary thiamine-phosphate synthase enzyme
MRAVKVLSRTLTLSSEQHFQVIDVTKQIRDVVLAAEIREGVLLVNPLHTTCALLVSDSHWADDLKTAMERLVAERAGYKHDDPRFSDCERGNACSHLRAALLGRSVAVGISGGELSLGSFQSILLVELDGPRRRGVDVQLLGA